MGIIKQAKTALENQYIQAADAIKYLVKVDGSDVAYSDVAGFLLREKFAEQMAGLSYARAADGSFYDTDAEYSEIGEYMAPAAFDADAGELFSADTARFLNHVAIHQTLEEPDIVLGRKAFNLYWNVGTFSKVITEILQGKTTDPVQLPPILTTLAEIREIEQAQQKAQPKTTSAKAANMQASIIAALAMMYTKTDCARPYEAAETIRQEWERQADTLGRTDNYLA